MQLRKQKTFLKNRQKEMLHYNLQYLDKLDALKKKERLEQKEAECRELYAINFAGSSKRPDHGRFSSDLPFLS